MKSIRRGLIYWQIHWLALYTRHIINTPFRNPQYVFNLYVKMYTYLYEWCYSSPTERILYSCICMYLYVSVCICMYLVVWNDTNYIICSTLIWFSQLLFSLVQLKALEVSHHIILCTTDFSKVDNKNNYYQLDELDCVCSMYHWSSIVNLHYLF